MTHSALSHVTLRARLQKALATLAKLNPEEFAEPAKLHSEQALRLSETALELDRQKGQVRTLASAV